MTKYDELKTKVAELITENATKEQIEKGALIAKSIDDLATEASKQEEDYKGLLKDYSDLIKHTAYTPTTPVDEGTKEFSFEDFANKWAENNKK